MHAILTPRGTGWLALCQQISREVEAALHARPRRADRDRVVGLGQGGDRTVEIDRVAEDVVVENLERFAADGFSFTLVSEELGTRAFGDADAPWRIVVDPIDGSHNAKRGLPFFSTSIAIADGPALGDVAFGFVHDFGSGEEWVAERGGGAALGGESLGEEAPKEAFEVVAFEATSAPLVAEAAARLPDEVERVRVLGSAALSLCQLAAGRVDAVATLRPIRAVDIAAAQLLLRETGLAFALPDDDLSALEAPLDVVGRSRLVAARDAAGCERLAGLLPPLAAGRHPA